MYLSISADMGGAERSLFDILSSVRMAQPAWPVHLVAAADGPLIQLARGIGVATDVLPLPPAIARLGEADAGQAALSMRLLRAAVSSASYVKAIGESIDRFAPDVIHTNSLKMHLLGAQAAGKTRSRTRVVWHMHDYLGSRPTT